VAKALILFRLVNIPTLGDESSQKQRALAVKKWDKGTVDAEYLQVFLKMLFGATGFLKQDCQINVYLCDGWEEYPLFKRQRLLLLVFLSFSLVS
jgi:hypothetical protein